jgi:hypothetical protein
MAAFLWNGERWLEGNQTRALSIHSIEVRQMQIPRKYADIASQTNKVTDAL